MEYQDFLEVVTFFLEDINNGLAILKGGQEPSSRVIIVTDMISTNQIVKLDKKGYHVTIFASESETTKIKLIISKY